MRKNLLLTVIALLTMCSVTFGQGNIVSGTVKADDGTLLPGTAVQIKGTTVGVTSDLDGNYSIDVSGHDNPVLIFTFVGYTPVEVEVGSQTEISVSLSTDMLSVDELVVVGYGVQKKSLVTGSISKVKSEELVSRPVSRVEQALQGKVSGVNVLANSGSPGSGLSITIRGAGSNTNSNPLYIVDGMRTKGIDYLSPNDIESVEILKDAASSAIYGSEGGNGVILITTKSGKKGAVTVDYNMYYGIQKFNSNLKVMNSDQYLNYFSDATLLEAQSGLFYDNDAVYDLNSTEVQSEYQKLVNRRNLLLPGADVSDTRWIDEVTENAPIMSHDLSISGGTEMTTYSGSLGYFTQDGVVGGSQANFKRYSVRLKVEHKQNDWLTIGAKMNYSLRQRTNISENDEFGSVMLNSYFFDPTVPVVYHDDSEAPLSYQPYSDYFVRDGNGNAYGMSSLVRNEIINPVAQLKNSHSKFDEDKILSGAHIDIHPINGLNVRTSFDADIANNQSKDWFPKAFYNSVTFTDYTDVIESRHRYVNWQWETFANYVFKIAERHEFAAMVGYTLIEQNHEWVGMKGRGLVRDNDDFAHIAFAQGDTLRYFHNKMSGLNPAQRMESYYGRLTYNYNELILFNFTLRRDGSSLLSPTDKNDYNWYPSYSLGYVLSNSAFWTVPQINYFKIRASYGSNGNKNAIDRSFYYAPLIGATGYNYNDAGGNILQGAVPVSLINEALTWETVKMYDFGIDMNLFNNKLGFVADYYSKSTKDLLMPAQLPGYLGNEPPFTNAGEIVNSGLEFELTYRHLEGDLQFDVSGNFTYNLKNECVSLLNNISFLRGTDLGVSGPVTRTSVDDPLYYFYGYKADGLWESWEQIQNENYIDGNIVQEGACPGDIKIVDVNNDSVISGEDRTNIGVSTPNVVAGLTFNVYYKSFDLGVNIISMLGKDIYNGTYRNDIAMSNKPEYYYTDGWNPETGGDFFRPTYSSRYNFEHNSLFVENGSFVKLKNIQIGYTLPVKISQLADIKKLRAYISLNNLLTITKYHGADPEVGATSSFQNASGDWVDDISSVGVDRGYYPQPKSFLIGLNVTF
jgi:TonB-dependent starch-binding outer membrane protein SusC